MSERKKLIPVDIDSSVDFGFGFSEDLTESLTETAVVAQNKATTMFNMILPLLNNLKKSPEKPNIVWPDREQKINDFISKLEAILKQ